MCAHFHKEFFGCTVIVAEDPVPAEASELPVLDKPVTLNFKGTVTQKTGISLCQCMFCLINVA